MTPDIVHRSFSEGGRANDGAQRRMTRSSVFCLLSSVFGLPFRCRGISAALRHSIVIRLSYSCLAMNDVRRKEDK